MNDVDSSLPTPPDVSGAKPVIGHAMQFWRTPFEVMRRGYEEHGRAFSLKVGPQRLVVLLGPEHNKWFFDNTDGLLSYRDGYPFMIRMFDEDLYFFAEPDDYQTQRRIILPRFHGAQLRDYVGTMALEVRGMFDRLGNDATFDLLSEMGPLVMHIAARTFLGDDFRARLGAEFFWTFRDFSEGLEPVVPGWIPTPAMLKSRLARRRLHRWLRGIIAERRNGPVDPPDFLQSLVDSTDENGEFLHDDKLINLMLLLVWAGHETTAGHTAWALIDLLQNPTYLQRVQAEIDDVLGEDVPMTRDRTKKLGHLDRALKETERLHPVAYVLMRGAKRRIELDGYSIPEGSLVALSPALSHRLPDVFPDPEVFRPDRFDRDVQELPPNHSLVGFGGGLHRCAGVKFAYLEMTVILAMLLREYEVELLDPSPQPVAGSATKWPASPARVRVRRRKGVAPVPTEGTDRVTATGCPYHR